MISCGEPSGDLYAGALATEIARLSPGAQITGFGGDRLRAAGASLAGDFGGLSVTGLTEALRVLPRSWRLYRRLVESARAERPDVFVPVDFPDFNFFLARALKRIGVPVVYYVSPQLWAWRRGERVIVALNLGDDRAAVDVSSGIVRIGTERERDGERVAGSLALGPWEGAIVWLDEAPADRRPSRY